LCNSVFSLAAFGGGMGKWAGTPRTLAKDCVLCTPARGLVGSSEALLNDYFYISNDTI